MPNVVRAWANDSTNRGPSTRLWRRQHPLTGQRWTDPNQGIGFFDDFNEIFATGNRYTLTEADLASSIAGDGSYEFGAVNLTAGSTANDEATLALLEVPNARISQGNGRVWFEARLKLSSVTDGQMAMAIGLAQVGGAGADFIVDTTGEVSDVDFVGFSVDAGNGDALRLVYNTAGGGGITEHSANAATLAADTWFKVGVFFDGNTTLQFYHNGEPVGSAVDITGTNFPDGEYLSLAVGAKSIAAAAHNLRVDWWAALQEAA